MLLMSTRARGKGYHCQLDAAAGPAASFGPGTACWKEATRSGSWESSREVPAESILRPGRCKTAAHLYMN